MNTCDGGRTHTAVSNSESDEAQHVFSPRGEELKPGSTLTTGSGVVPGEATQSPSCPPCMSETSLCSLLLQILHDREEGRIGGGGDGYEHAVNRTLA